MPNINRPKRSGVSAAVNKIKDVPGTPTIGTPTVGNIAGTVIVPVTPNPVGGGFDQFIVTSTPGSIVTIGDSGQTSLVATGLTEGADYTFTAVARTAAGTSSATSSSTAATARPSSGQWLIQRQNGTGAASGIYFTNIPQYFSQLKLVCNSRCTGTDATDYIIFQINSVGTNTYQVAAWESDGTSTTRQNNSKTTNGIGAFTAGGGATAGVYGTAEIDFLDYSSTTKVKTFRGIAGWMSNSSTTGQNYGVTGTYTATLPGSTAAVTSIQIYCYGPNSWTTGSSFALYGVL